MKTVSPIYPGLSRYFSTIQEIADASCMSRVQAWRCLTGQTDFKPTEKMAITNAILAKVLRGEIDQAKVRGMIEGKTTFDEYFKLMEES